jgi:hypothetical protein
MAVQSGRYLQHAESCVLRLCSIIEYLGFVRSPIYAQFKREERVHSHVGSLPPWFCAIKFYFNSAAKVYKGIRTAREFSTFVPKFSVQGQKSL